MTTNKITMQQLKGVKSASDLLVLVYGVAIKDMKLPINADSIIECLEKVNFSDELSIEDWDKSGYINVVRDDSGHLKNIDIWVNPSEVDVRQRFTTAHELGHLVNDIVPDIDNSSKSESFVDKLHRDGTTSFKETRANKFAAQLLMPKELVKREVDKLVNQVKVSNKGKVPLKLALEKLSAVFNVSEQSIEIRLRNLGFIR